MAVQTERWSRGAGSGIGLSSHINEYSCARAGGVLIGNFVEERVFHDPSSSSRPPQWPMPNTTQRSAFNAYGKTGEDLLIASQRHDQRHSDLSFDMLSRHGDFSRPREHDCATVYQLTHSLRGADAHRTQRYLWEGAKQNDLPIPTIVNGFRATQHLSQTGQPSSSTGWQGTSLRGTFGRSTSAAPLRPSPIQHNTTATAALLESALLATEAPEPVKRATLRPGAADSPTGTVQVGRKPVGPHAEECDKVYRRTGLRREYYYTHTGAGAQLSPRRH